MLEKEVNIQAFCSSESIGFRSLEASNAWGKTMNMLFKFFIFIFLILTNTIYKYRFIVVFGLDYMPEL